MEIGKAIYSQQNEESSAEPEQQQEEQPAEEQKTEEEKKEEEKKKEWLNQIDLFSNYPNYLWFSQNKLIYFVF